MAELKEVEAAVREMMFVGCFASVETVFFGK